VREVCALMLRYDRPILVGDGSGITLHASFPPIQSGKVTA
jgi:hypothetical protein